MVIVSFGGGLGNQMFQFAFYETLKEIYPNTAIKADMMNVFSVDHNGYELEDIFGVKVEKASIYQILHYSSIYPHTAPLKKIGSFWSKVRTKLFGVKKSHIYLRDNSKYDDFYLYLNNKKSYYLLGVWANSQYLQKTKIDKFFEFPVISDQQNLRYVNAIQNSNSVSLHMRRGDYVGSDFYNLDQSYYRNAIEIINSKVEEPTFFIFSDDFDYATKFFEFLPNKVVVQGNIGKRSYIDMQLTSMCKHNIIANSTFSFWGAYLNSNESKIVICPDVWMPRLEYPLYCDGWTMIKGFEKEK